MEERDKKTELLVGLFLLVGLLLLGLLILQFGSVRELFKTTYEITVPFPDGTGIKEGTPIMLGGSKIGKVPRLPKLNEQFNGVIIPLEIYQDKKIPADAKFSIGTAGLLGDAFIEIRPTGAVTTAYIEPGAVLTKDNVATAKGLNGLQDTAVEIGKKVDVALSDLEDGIKDLRVTLKKINEGALSDKGVADIKETLSHLNSVMTRLDEKTFGEDTNKDVKETIASLKSAAKSIEDSSKKLDPVFTKADKVMTKLDSAAGKMDAVVASTNTAIQNFDKVAKVLGKGKGDGLLPALLHDDALKNEFKLLITNLRHQGVFWYKDKAGEEQEKQRQAAPTRTGGTKR